MSPLDTERVDGAAIARVREDIDAANVNAVQQELDHALGPDASSLVIDLSDTRYLDSAGIDMLLRLNQRLKDRRATLILVIPDNSQTQPPGRHRWAPRRDYHPPERPRSTQRRRHEPTTADPRPTQPPHERHAQRSQLSAPNAPMLAAANDRQNQAGVQSFRNAPITEK